MMPHSSSIICRFIIILQQASTSSNPRLSVILKCGWQVSFLYCYILYIIRFWITGHVRYMRQNQVVQKKKKKIWQKGHKIKGSHQDQPIIKRSSAWLNTVTDIYLTVVLPQNAAWHLKTIWKFFVCRVPGIHHKKANKTSPSYFKDIYMHKLTKKIVRNSCHLLESSCYRHLQDCLLMPITINTSQAPILAIHPVNTSPVQPGRGIIMV